MDTTPLIFSSSVENIQTFQSSSGSIEFTFIIPLAQAGFNTLASSSSSDINTQVPFYTSVVVPDIPQPSISFTDSGSSYHSSVSRISSTTKVRFILIGVLTFLSGFLILPMLIKKLCNRDRRRRMTIRLVRKHSDTNLHLNHPSSPASFLVGDKSVEGGFSTGSVTTGEKRLSNAPSAGLAGIGINNSNYVRYNHNTFPQPGDENHVNSNFDNPYGTPTYMIGQSFAVSPSYAAHLPRKVPRGLELSSMDNLGNAQCHGQAILKPYPVPLKTARAISPALPRTKLRSGVSSWLKNGNGFLPNSAMNYSNSQSPSFITHCTKSSERSMTNNNIYDAHYQSSKTSFSPTALVTYPYHNQSSHGNSVMDDTKRNGRMIFLKDSAAAVSVSLNNPVTNKSAAPCNICSPSPASSATRTPPSARLLITKAKMEKAHGIAF